MEKLLLVGAGGFGRVVLEHASLEYDCSFVDDGVEKGSFINDVEVIGSTNDLGSLKEQFNKLVVTIGNNKTRQRIYDQATKLGYSFPNIVQKTAFISKQANVGNGCIILNNAVIQNGARIGNGVIINPGVEIHHDCCIGDNVLIYTNSVVRSLARIGARAHIGSTLTISNEVIIPDDAVIPDGHTVNK